MASLKRSQLLEIINDEGKSPDEIVNLILSEHQKVLTEIKEERDNYKEQAEKLPDLQKQLEKLTGEAEEFAKEKKSFEDYKKKVEQNETAAKVKAAYTQMLKDENYTDWWMDRILESTNFSDIKIGDDGKLVDEKSLREAVNEKWSRAKTTVTEKGAAIDKPPQIGKSTMTKDQIYAIKDTAERQKAIAENHELFGI